MRHLSIAMKSWAAARDVRYASLVPCFSDCFCEEVHGPGCQGVAKRISWVGRGDAWGVSRKREAGVVLSGGAFSFRVAVLSDLTAAELQSRLMGRR